jgi:hypothetical protein
MCATVGVILVGDFSLGTRVLLVLNVWYGTVFYSSEILLSIG